MLHQATAGPLKDIHRVVSKLPVLFCLCTLGCCPSERRMFSRALLSMLSIRMSLHIAAFFWPWWVSRFLQPQRIMLLFSMNGVGQVMIDVWIPPDICLAFRPKISVCLITPENFVFHGQRVLQLPFWQTPDGLFVSFAGEWTLSGHLTIQAECCRRGYPSKSVFSIYRTATLELCLIVHWVLGQLSD